MFCGNIIRSAFLLSYLPSPMQNLLKVHVERLQFAIRLQLDAMIGIGRAVE